MNGLNASFERDRFELLGNMHSQLWKSFEWYGHQPYENDINSCPTKNSSKRFIHKWGQAGNELKIT